MSQENNPDNPNTNNLEHTNNWTQVSRSRLTRRNADSEQTNEVRTNRFVQGLTQLNNSQNSETTHQSSMNGRNMNVLYRLNSEQDKRQNDRDEHRELMQRYMYRRQKEPEKQQVSIQSEPVDMLDTTSFPSLLKKPVETNKVADSLSSVFDELVIDVKQGSNAWKNKDIKTIMETNKDKKVSPLISNKSQKKSAVVCDSINVIVDFSALYTDLLKNSPIDIDEESVNPIDDDGFIRVLKPKKKILY